MKKIFITLFILFLTFTNIFAYTPNKNDENILNKIYTKLDPICKKSPKSCKIFIWKVDNAIEKYNKNKKILYILTELKNHILTQISKQFSTIKEKISLNLEKSFVTKVSDWDTIHFKKNWKYYVARLIWIDAPENSTTRYWHTERLWDKAKDYLQNLILNKNIYIEYDKTQARTDRYWRHLIYIFYDWKNINQQIIESWLAKEYTYNKPYKYQKEFKLAQKLAQSKKLWIWGLSKNIQQKVIKNIDNHDDNVYNNCKIKWNINSKWKKIYHLPWCKSYNQTKITISKWEKWFCSESKAQKSGFKKAGNCN